MNGRAGRDATLRIDFLDPYTRIECAVTLALATGMRRGEILALAWSDLDERALTLRVRRSLQATAAGLVFAE